ncbi:hypothetical protein ANCDUO_05211 [Ancylostoma duodenale]|uniref:Uncharacterized protein n=1 Tax=Ancylostoma duodenale TaxID=51022 RepID=A0A0C2D4R0_9BILA|nr:hypothetical protein ANCDUO_05211 [Ancylostoma duodenale]
MNVNFNCYRNLVCGRVLRRQMNKNILDVRLTHPVQIALLFKEQDAVLRATLSLLIVVKMRRLILLGIFGAVVAADMCTCGTGNWSYEFASGVTDFAHGGEQLSNSSCFSGCLATGLVYQNFKVALRDKRSTSMVRKLSSKADHKAHLRKMRGE